MPYTFEPLSCPKSTISRVIFPINLSRRRGRAPVDIDIWYFCALLDAIDAPREDYEAHADEREEETDREYVV